MAARSSRRQAGGDRGDQTAAVNHQRSEGAAPILRRGLLRALRRSGSETYNQSMDIRHPAEIHIPPKPQEALEDRKLLDRPSREETLQSDSWRVLRITSEFVAGFDHLADVYPAVAIFGSARTKLSNKYYDAAVRTAELIGKAGFAIITGGGPGIMEAANRGARQAGALSVGCNIELPFEQKINEFVDRAM